MPREAKAACLTDETVALLLEGTLPTEDRSDVLSHVDACESCRRLVADSADDSTSPPSDGALVVGEVIADKYEVIGFLGEGGMGGVFEARHLELQHVVAVKVMHEEALADADAVSRFMREARIAAQLQSDHAVRTHDVGRLPSGVPYLVMELLVGDDLDTVQARRELTVAEAVGFVLEATEALAEAHALGLIHRDLKPKNLFLAQLPGGARRVKVIDFGLAKDLGGATTSATLTTDEMVLGSPNFMSPEQVRAPRDVDARTDVWGLGATLFHLLTGRPPFSAASAHGVFARILTDPVPLVRALRPEVSPELERAIARALEKDVDQRFPDMRAFAAALRAASQTDVETAPSTERMEGRPAADLRRTQPLENHVASIPPATRSRSSFPLLFFAALAAIVVAAGVVAMVQVTRRADRAPQSTPAAPSANPPKPESTSSSAPVASSASASTVESAPAPVVSTKRPVVHGRPATPASADPYKR